MAIGLNGSLQNKTPYADNYYYCQPNSSTPWQSVLDAHNGIESAYRGQGKTFLVMTGGEPKEYWYKGGTELQHLVPKDANLGNILTYTREGLIAATGITATMVKISDAGDKNMAVYDKYDTTSTTSENIIRDAGGRRYRLYNVYQIIEILASKISLLPE